MQLSTSGLSNLVGSLQVYNAARQLVGSVAATDPLHGDLTVSVGGGLSALFTQLLGGGTYYVRVAGNGDPAFGVGSYKLTVSYQLSDGTLRLLALFLLTSRPALAGDRVHTAAPPVTRSQPAPAPRLSGSAVIERPRSRWCGHTDQVLAELGYTADEVAVLRAGQAVA